MGSEDGDKINYREMLPAIIGLIYGVGILIVAIIIFYGVQIGLIAL